MYDENEESFYYNRSKSMNEEVSGAAAGVMVGLVAGIISAVLGGILFLIARFDIASSGLLALLFYTLTYQHGWEGKVYLIGAIMIVVVSMLLQHKVKVFRILFGLFTCVIASLLGPILIGYDSDARMYLIMAICFGVTALWGFLSWRFVAD